MSTIPTPEPGATPPGAAPPDAVPTGSRPPGGAGAGTSLGVDPSVAGLLAYAFGWLSGLVILLLEKQHRPVRFHAAQSLVLWGAVSVFWIVVSATVWIPFLGWILGLVGLVLIPVFIGLWVFTMIKGYQQADLRLPLVATIADRLADGVGR